MGAFKQIAIEAAQAESAGNYDYAEKLRHYIFNQCDHPVTCGWPIGKPCTCTLESLLAQTEALMAAIEIKQPVARHAINLSLQQRDEPQLAKLRRESEGGCPIGFRSFPR